MARVRAFGPGDTERQRQDFLAGTVPAARAAVTVPETGPGSRLGLLFMVFLHEDRRTFGPAPAPAIRDAFGLLEHHGGLALARNLDAGAAWAGLGGPGPLVKLKIEFAAPVRGPAAVMLDGSRHAHLWQHIAGGGLMALTSRERIAQATTGTAASFASVMAGSVLLGRQDLAGRR
ncbi:hypothetical protein [Streptomyces hiroshimensis]|uniref:Uncharacterized protein n=1 Tax=Streptomyces hiroshimensis TaxID=66424 RepID=A0ABQ2ZBI8_9ACTN|nr:hypothetical protein [Streptomyces hiroshimensis]GGY11348.1 hypothetical protein GCM10010324_67560 [Streptomyces hiroshimensis]